MRTKLISEIKVGNLLGEGVNWRCSDNTVWWTDIQKAKLYRLEWPAQNLTVFELPERLASFSFVKGRDDLLLTAFSSGIALYRPKDGKQKWLDKPIGLSDSVRLNDGRTDGCGRFWVGSMAENSSHLTRYGGVLYRINENGIAEATLGHIGISNGLCWSPDDKTVYFADTIKRTVYKASYDSKSAVFGRLEPFIQIDNGGPDGAVTDDEGNIWIAIWGSGTIEVYTTEGKKFASLKTFAPHTTCPAFGGSERNLLFVTTAQQDLTESELKDNPSSGSLLIYETDISGPASTPAIVSAHILSEL